MIRLTRLNHVPLILNSDLIQHIEMTPDTVVALTTGETFMVLESADEIVDLVIAFRRVASGASQPTSLAAQDSSGHLEPSSNRA